MESPKTMAKAGLEQSWVELIVLFALTAVGATLLFDMHWLIAMALTPFMMLAMLLSVMVFVQLLWMTVLGLERIGTACGLRKSPLA